MILVVIEYRKQKLAEISIEVLSKGRQLAEYFGSELVAVVIGKNVSIYTEQLSELADKVLAVEDDKIEEPLAEPYQKILSKIIKEKKPLLVLMGHSSFAMDLAPALAMELGYAIATDCTDIDPDNGKIIVARPLYNGKVIAKYSVASAETIIITCRSGVLPRSEMQSRGVIERISPPFREEISYKKFLGYVEPEVKGVDITKASVLISIGRGMKDKENIAMAQELAEALGGEVACSRPIVDYGWLPSEHQVGMSGKIVRPDVYLALGISGSFQHVVGIRGSKIIIAVNKDTGAPIFNVAHYGVVEDILIVMPVLKQKIIEIK
ncbi:electron transfer flavoprotein subunit alpha/FixB family protein [Chloroflexota bacterium]